MNEFLKSILDGIHTLVPSYGWSIVLFTILIRLVLMPLDYKSRVGMRKMSKLAPKQAELQKKYAKDQEKLQRKMAELYKKEGASPMSSCWPMLVSMPVLLAMFAAMRYMANEELVRQTFNILLTGDTVLEPFLWVKNLWMPDSPFAAAWPDAASLKLVEQNQWLAIFNSLPADSIAALAQAIGVTELNAASFMAGENLNATITAITAALAAMPEYVAQTSPISYMTIDLLITRFSVVTGWNGLFLLPVLSALSQYLMTVLQPSQPAPSADGKQQQGGGFMKWFFPLFSLWLCSSYNAGFALYWVTSNIIAMIQTQLINWYLDRKEAAAALAGDQGGTGNLK